MWCEDILFLCKPFPVFLPPPHPPPHTNTHKQIKHNIIKAQNLSRPLTMPFLTFYNYLFSSSEQEELMARYCDRLCPSSVFRTSPLFALNDFSSLSAKRILEYLHRNVPRVTLYKICSNRFAPLDVVAIRAKIEKKCNNFPTLTSGWILK